MTERSSKNCYRTYSKRPKTPRKPLRTTVEMAEEFGVPVGVLRAEIACKGAPEGVFYHTSVGSPSRVYHDPDELRKWWKSIRP